MYGVVLRNESCGCDDWFDCCPAITVLWWEWIKLWELSKCLLSVLSDWFLILFIEEVSIDLFILSRFWGLSLLHTLRHSGIKELLIVESSYDVLLSFHLLLSTLWLRRTEMGLDRSWAVLKDNWRCADFLAISQLYWLGRSGLKVCCFINSLSYRSRSFWIRSSWVSLSN